MGRKGKRAEPPKPARAPSPPPAPAATRPTRSNPPPPPSAGREALYPFLIAGATILAYLNSFAVPFMFDDDPAIVNNRTIRSLWPIWRAFWGPDETGVSGRPFLNFTFALNHAISGYAVWSYHLFNLAIHICAALALFGLVRRTLLLERWRAAFGAGAAEFALCAALLWALHPIQTQAVTYLIIRNESLMGLFYILTLYCFVRAAAEPGGKRWPACAVAACALGMASKETMATAPLLVFLFDRCVVAGSFKEALDRRRALHGALAATWLLAAVLIVSGPRQNTTGFGLHSVSSLDYLKLESEVLVRYLRLALLPWPLVFDYGRTALRSWSQIAPHFAAIAALAAATLWALWRRPTLGFLAACFFIILGPTSSLMPTSEPCWEYRMYLPLAALIVLALLGARAALAAFAPPARRRTFAISALAAVALAYGGLTLARNHDYRTEADLLDDTLSKRPDNPRSQSDKGDRLFRAGQVEAAIPYFQRALELDPAYYNAAFNLATALYRLGRHAEAGELFDTAAQISPKRGEPRNGLGMALLKQGDAARALGEIERAIALDPALLEAKLNRSRALAILNRIEEARANLEEAKGLFPNDPRVPATLEALLNPPAPPAPAATSLDAEIDRRRKAADAAPADGAARRELGVALDAAGRIDEALAAYREALRLNPADADAQNNLGVCLARQGKMGDAIAAFKKALEIKPGHADAMKNLDKAQGGK